jgi:uncharacterized protein
MELCFFHIDDLEQKLKQLSPLHQLAFAASICERMLPNYNAFSRMENCGEFQGKLNHLIKNHECK